jgi:hypothetical protein
MNIETSDNKYSVFPQANDIYRVVAFVGSLIPNPNMSHFNFVRGDITSRQIHYYKAAAEYLGLLSKGTPSELSNRLFKLEKNVLLISIMRIILTSNCFYDYFKNQNDDNAIEYLMNNYSLSKVTAYRRLSTIKSWCKWCHIIADENGITIE